MTLLVRFAGVVLVASLAGSHVDAKIKQDVVIMKNGDRFTGEIKKLENGFLYFKADYMADTVQLDWARVERLESKDEFTVFLSNGGRDTGTIEKTASSDPTDENFLIHSQNSSNSVLNADVVTINPMDSSFWRQLTGSFNYGFTLTGSTSTTQSNFSGDVTYRSENWAGKMDGESVFSRQNGAKNAGRNNIDLYYYKYKGPRWFVAGTAGFLNSQQQDLTARESLGGGIGMDVFRRPTSSLQLLGGALLTNEKYSTEGSRSGRGADAQILLQYSKYARFTKFQFTTDLGVFPSLSTPGRVRLSLQSNLSHELFKNFKLVFSVYENYDSSPPVVAPKSDFGTSTSVGWSFP
jgi:Protein of unknown function, DUF481